MSKLVYCSIYFCDGIELSKSGKIVDILHDVEGLDLLTWEYNENQLKLFIRGPQTQSIHGGDFTLHFVESTSFLMCDPIETTGKYRKNKIT